jgi:hypothetical protein
MGLTAARIFGFRLRFSFVTGFFKPAPSPKPRPKPKILAAHRYIFSVNALINLPYGQESRRDINRQERRDFDTSPRPRSRRRGRRRTVALVADAYGLVMTTYPVTAEVSNQHKVIG